MGGELESTMGCIILVKVGIINVRLDVGYFKFWVRSRVKVDIIKFCIDTKFSHYKFCMLMKEIVLVYIQVNSFVWRCYKYSVSKWGV